MPSADKIKIKNLENLRSILKDLGALISSSTKIKDTYFKQPSGTVLKIRTERGKPPRVIHFRKVTEGFENLKTPEESIETLAQRFKQEFGIDKELSKTIETIQLGENEISLHLISNLGNFLVVNRGERAAIAKELALIEAEFFATPFNEL